MVNVSIIIPLYNDCAYWNKLIGSVAKFENQTRPL